MKHIKKFNESEVTNEILSESIKSRSIQTVNFSDLTKNKDYSTIDEYDLWDVGYNLIPNLRGDTVDIVVSVKKFISEFEHHMGLIELGDFDNKLEFERKIQMEFELLKKELSNIDYIFLT